MTIERFECPKCRHRVAGPFYKAGELIICGNCLNNLPDTEVEDDSLSHHMNFMVDTAKTIMPEVSKRKCDWCGGEFNTDELWFRVDGRYQCDPCNDKAKESLTTVKEKPHTFSSGATSSEKLPSYHLLPFEDFAPRLAARYQLGIDKGYGRDNWRTGLTDDAFVIDRLNHGIQHLHRAAEKISRGDYSLEGDDDLAGALWACVCAMAAQKVRNK